MNTNVTIKAKSKKYLKKFVDFGDEYRTFLIRTDKIRFKTNFNHFKSINCQYFN